jgi:hypothetical protein
MNVAEILLVWRQNNQWIFIFRESIWCLIAMQISLNIAIKVQSIFL